MLHNDMNKTMFCFTFPRMSLPKCLQCFLLLIWQFFLQNCRFDQSVLLAFCLHLLFFIGIMASILPNTLPLEQPVQLSSECLVLDSLMLVHFPLENISSNSRFDGYFSPQGLNWVYYLPKVIFKLTVRHVKFFF